MQTTDREPTLLFFRKRPLGWRESASITGSLQSIETSFFLTALGRHPHAILVCASAIESCLQAASIGAKERDGLQDLIKKAGRESVEIQNFPTALLDRLREARNRIVHRGFSPHDDSESVSIYLETCLPFLELCYKQFHSFDLMDGLLLEYARHIRSAQKIYTLAQATPGLDLTYCVRGLSHTIRWSLKESFSSGSEIDELIHAEEVGSMFDHKLRERKRLEDLFEVPWLFNCPICGEFDAAVAEVDADKIDEYEIVTHRLECTNCGFVAHSDHPYLSEVLLENQLITSKAQILKKLGVA